MVSFAWFPAGLDWNAATSALVRELYVLMARHVVGQKLFGGRRWALGGHSNEVSSNQIGDLPTWISLSSWLVTMVTSLSGLLLSNAPRCQDSPIYGQWAQLLFRSQSQQLGLFSSPSLTLAQGCPMGTQRGRIDLASCGFTANKGAVAAMQAEPRACVMFGRRMQRPFGPQVVRGGPT